MSELLRGRMTVSSYTHLLQNLLEIYSELERQLSAHRTHPAIASVFDPSLFRFAPLRHDLAALASAAQASAPILSATYDYVARLRAIGRSTPPLLVSHAYVRYLGDLHGGQLLRRILRRSTLRAAPDATEFYEFGPPSTVAHRIQQLRKRIDDVGRALPDRQAEIVEEAVQAFERHALIFEQLESRRDQPFRGE